ncbi:hypothetical protein BLNAU_3682 [Blattamonas nauphoetae]|uniref:Uncharacterized protein n=1 Tax=Blattamonas nauphoetae TaxID=2049346 RepID=A0ABQ9YC48_9EUKA|nr:hypothetical protein BLNAU_3682 [Blattamonas nauphoetae]
MCLRCFRKKFKDVIEYDDPMGVSVQSLTLHRSNDDGELGDPVAGLFYTTEERIYARIELNRIEPGLKGKISWICRDSYGVGLSLFFVPTEFLFSHIFLAVPPNFEIVSCLVEPIQMAVIYAHAELPRSWPPGTYDVRFFINDKLARVAPFKIIEPKTIDPREEMTDTLL